MEAELAGLAVSGATALVNAMAGDGWNAVKARVAALLRRGRSAGGDDLEGRLDEERRELTAAREEHDEDAVADLEGEWRRRLRRLLLEDPQAASVLRELIAETGAEERAARVHNSITGGEFHGTVVQAGDISGGITFH